jgi:hypothetical protein
MEKRLKILILYENRKFEKAIRYAFNLIMTILGIGYEISQVDEIVDNNLTDFSLVISYGKKIIITDIKNQIHIYESGFFGKDYLEKESLPQTPLRRFSNMPIIYQGTEKLKNNLRKSLNLIETDIDIIASSFFMITRYEEVIIKEKDKYGRFPAKASLAYKEGFLDRPIVNEYIDLLWSWIDSFNLGYERRNLWGNEDFAVCLTHDVDEIEKYRRPPLFSVLREIRNGKIKKSFKIVVDYLKTKLGLRKDPCKESIESLIEIEEKYNFKSSFYFMVNEKRYSLNDLWINNLFLELKERGFEIGIHPGFDAYNNLQVFRQQKKYLEEKVDLKIRGGRNHYLNFKNPQSWEIFENTGLEYDTTLGYAGFEGFRCGICHPFKPFNLIKRTTMSFWEVPLIAMDITLFNYRKLSSKQVFRIIHNLFKKIERHKGVFVLLLHASFEKEAFSSKDVVQYIYNLNSEKNCLIDTVQTMIKSYHERE